MQVPFNQRRQVQSSGAAPRPQAPLKADGFDELARAAAGVGQAIDQIHHQASEQAKAEKARLEANRRQQKLIQYQEWSTQAKHGDAAAKAAQSQILSRPPLEQADGFKNPWSTDGDTEGPDAFRHGTGQTSQQAGDEAFGDETEAPGEVAAGDVDDASPTIDVSGMGDVTTSVTVEGY